MPKLYALVALLVLPAASLAQSSTAPDISGQWSGYWVSEKNGHTGPLRARITQLNAQQYRATFSGRFASVIPFRYSAKLDVVGVGDGVVVLVAERPLGLRGSYRTTAVVTASNFDARFTAPRDWGRFVMTRR